MDICPARPPRAAHRLRRHRRRDRRDQRRRPRPLPAQALGPAGGEALPGRRRAAGGVARGRPAPGRRDPGRRPPLVGPLLRRSATSSPATRCPTAGTPSDDAGGRAAAGGGRARRADDVPLVVTPDGTALRNPTDAELAARGRAHHRPGERLLRPRRHRRRPGRASAPRCTARPRGCAPCSSSGRRPAGRPGRARASRTTSASPTASPAPSSPTAPGGRRPSSAPSCSPPATSSRWRCSGSARIVRFADGSDDRRARGRPRHRRVLPALDAPGRRRAHRPRRVLRLRGHRGARLRGPGRLHRRRGQLGRPGGGVLLPARAHGHAAGARADAWRRRCRTT